jgi:hypothetical protein
MVSTIWHFCAVVAAVAWLIICRLHELLKRDSRRKQAVNGVMCLSILVYIFGLV